MSCNCTTPCTSSCPSYCGCTVQVPGTCVFYQGSNLDCINATKGDTYDSILANINSILCTPDPPPPSGNTTVVTGCSSITVTPTVVGSTTTYNVCLSSATQTQITNNTANIATLTSCVNNSVYNLVSTDGSVTIGVVPPSGICGNILDLSVPAPTPPAILDGIIYNNSTIVPANSGIGTNQVLKTSGTAIHDYYTTNGLNVGDEIRWRSNGQIAAGPDPAGQPTTDALKIDLFDTPTGILEENIFGGFSTGSNVLNSWQAEATATVISNTPGNSTLFVTIKVFKTSLGNQFVGNSSTDVYVMNRQVFNVDLSSLEIRVKYFRLVPITLASSNYAAQHVVEIRKFI